MKRIIAFLAALVALFAAIPADAANSTLKASNYDWTFTPSTATVSIQCPSLASAAADTAIAVLDVSNVLAAYPGASGVPTWLWIAEAISTGADSVRVEYWAGPTTACRTKLSAMATDTYGILKDKTAKAFSTTLYAFRYLKVKIVNKHTTTAKSPLVYITFPRTFVQEGEHNQY